MARLGKAGVENPPPDKMPNVLAISGVGSKESVWWAMKDPDGFVDCAEVSPDDLGYPCVFRLDTETNALQQMIASMLVNGEHGETKILIHKTRWRVADIAELPEHQGW